MLSACYCHSDPLQFCTPLHKSTNKSFYTEMLIWLYIFGEIPFGYTGGISKRSNINAALKPDSNVALSLCETDLKQKIIRRLLLIQLKARCLNQVLDPLVKKTAGHMYTVHKRWEKQVHKSTILEILWFHDNLVFMPKI